MDNPFKPSFGRTPPELLDRTDVLGEFEYGLSLRSGVLGLLTIITGARGVGKTVMLNEAQDLWHANKDGPSSPTRQQMVFWRGSPTPCA